jgi:Leucine-rich repeat (LRR) protein
MQLQTLQLTMCGLQGNISASFANLTNLRSLNLSHNNLTGLLPQAIVDLPDLEILNVVNNKLLTGQLIVPRNLHLADTFTKIQRQ